MLILLPPSEGKATPRRGKRLDLETLGFPGLTPARDQVLDALVDLCAADTAHAEKVLGLGPTQTEDVRRNAGLRTAPTTRADALYTGVLYDHLDLASLDTAARGRATRWLAITSSLFGLVRPGDRIPAYRLSGDVSLPGIGVVSAHWRGVLDPVAREAAGTGLVIDLRSTTYASFWRPAPSWRAASPRSGSSSRSATSARWSATSTRPPRADWCVPCSSRDRPRPPPPRSPTSSPGWAGRPSWHPRPARTAARRGRRGALRDG